jgi:SOS-response transcriptional repressor LexA
MNRAKIRTFGNQLAGIDDGDMVIVERTMPADFSSKPYIVAVIDGLANIKKLVLGDGVAKLESESTSPYMPIYLTPEVENFICGVVVAVVKQ